MTPETSRYADFENLREQAVALRREGLSLRQIRDRLQVYNNDILHRLVKGEPPPQWTKHPNAKDDLRARARDLRLEGRTYDQIQLELGCSKSSETVRKNVGEDYRGCLVIDVAGSAELYCRIEGWWAGINAARGRVSGMV
ncbi:hypothetical protein OG566_24120 [Streptomyces sp. NBC_01353]|nr:hypothetical protein [Streptomyces sp. NBC_01353]